jgi:outer membrane protein assembly factor BamE
MKKIISLALIISFTLTGCSFFRPHKLDIVQGNVMTDENVSRLHPGMSESQVKVIMGTPVMVNIFSTNRFDYVFTNQPGHQNMTEKRVICTFVNGRLRDIQRG